MLIIFQLKQEIWFCRLSVFCHFDYCPAIWSTATQQTLQSAERGCMISSGLSFWTNTDWMHQCL